MENEENKSKWDDLARELGTPAAEPPERPMASQPPGSADAKRSARGPARSPARPKTSAKDWEDLAADLGIQPPAAPRAATPTTEMEATPMSAEESPPHSTGPPAAEELPASTEPAITHPEPSPDVAAEAGPTARGGGVSLWHKIFGTPEQQAERIVEAVHPADTAHVHEEHRQREDRPSELGGRSPDTRPEPSADDVEDAASWREPSADLSPEATEEDRERRGQHPPEDRESKRRRGRRRRRGRGRKVDGPAAAEVEAEGRDDVRPRRQRGRRPAPRPDDAADAEFDFDDDLDALEPDDVEDGGNGSGPDDETAKRATARGVAPRHRNIPSWEEAIGLIVDVNMQSRSERRRTSPQKSSRSGSARGGSRGRRNKKQ